MFIKDATMIEKWMCKESDTQITRLGGAVLKSNKKMGEYDAET
jgi:hypothetical protein